MLLLFYVLMSDFQQMISSTITYFSNLLRAAFLPESLENLPKEEKQKYGEWPESKKEISGAWLPHCVRYVRYLYSYWRQRVGLSPHVHLTLVISNSNFTKYLISWSKFVAKMVYFAIYRNLFCLNSFYLKFCYLKVRIIVPLDIEIMRVSCI